MSDAFIELDESIKQERLQKIWDQYGTLVITCLVSVIIGTALFQAFHAWDANVEQKQTSIMINALEKENAADILINAANDMRPNLRGIALLTAGGLFIESAKPAEALKAYTTASQDIKISSELRDIATLMSINLSSETNDTSAHLAKLEKIWSDTNSPWALQARLDAALLLAHKFNDYPAAIAQLDTILQTKNVSNPMRSKAGALKHVYSLQINNK